MRFATMARHCKPTARGKDFCRKACDRTREAAAIGKGISIPSTKDSEAASESLVEGIEIPLPIAAASRVRSQAFLQKSFPRAVGLQWRAIVANLIKIPAAQENKRVLGHRSEERRVGKK